MPSLTVKSKAKIIIAVILTVLLVIIILQNRETVETQLLFATLQTSRAAALFLSMGIGFVIGLLTALSFARRGKSGSEKKGKSGSETKGS